jgi:hypothetical protein
MLQNLIMSLELSSSSRNPFLIFFYMKFMKFLNVLTTEIPNIFQTGSEKPRKLAKSLNIFFSRTISATSEQKNSF